MLWPEWWFIFTKLTLIVKVGIDVVHQVQQDWRKGLKFKLTPCEFYFIVILTFNLHRYICNITYIMIHNLINTFIKVTNLLPCYFLWYFFSQLEYDLVIINNNRLIILLLDCHYYSISI